MIEGVQKFTAKHWQPNAYNDLLAQLGWPLLSTRHNRSYSCATAFYLATQSSRHPASYLILSYSPTFTPLSSLQTCHQIHCLLCLFFSKCRTIMEQFTPGHCFGYLTLCI